MRSSLSFQMLLFFHYYFVLLYSTSSLFFFIFKYNYLFYPPSYFVCDFLIFLSTGILEIVRLYIGKYGNLREEQVGVLSCLILTLPATLGTVYALLWQTYLLNIEFIFIIITFIFHALQAIYSVLLGISFSKKSTIG